MIGISLAQRALDDVLTGKDFPYEYERWSYKEQVFYEMWRLETLNVRLVHGDNGVTDVGMVASLAKDAADVAGPGVFKRKVQDELRWFSEVKEPFEYRPAIYPVPSVVPGEPHQQRRRRYAY